MKPDKETRDKWHADPANWRNTYIYYNKEDKRLFVPKRIKSMGWTINAANPYSVVVLIIILLIIFSAIIYTLKKEYS